MRKITVPHEVIEQCLVDAVEGKALHFPVKVDWPELQLSDDQRLANVMARIAGQTEPFPDHSIFVVELLTS